MIDMENERTYVYVIINHEADGIKTTYNTIAPSVGIDEAIAFLQKYRDEQTTPLL